MPDLRIPRISLALMLAPLALGLSACKKDGAAGAPTEASSPLPKVAAPAGKAWTDVVELTKDGGVLMGNPDAPIKVVEYGSLTCPHCAKFAQDGFARLTGEYVTSGRVSLEFRSFAIHPQDVPLTVLALCGGKETFFPLIEQIYGNMDELMAKSQAPGIDAQYKAAMAQGPDKRFAAVADVLGLTEFFAARGVSVDQAHACLANMDSVNAVANHSKAYSEAGIDSTPTLFVNAAKIDGNTWAELEPALQRAGAR